MTETNKPYKRKKTVNVSTVDKIQPQATELEEAVLGAIMLVQDAIFDVIDILVPNAFYDERHKQIYEAIVKLHSQRSPIDILTVTQQLRKNGQLELVGGAYYITQLTNRVTSSANIEYHSRIIMEKFLKRELIRKSFEVMDSAYDDTSDAFELLDDLGVFVGNAEAGIIATNEVSVSELALDMMKDLEKPELQDDIDGYRTGIDELDKLINGFIPGELIAIGARPAMGKTAALCSIAKAMNIDNGLPLALFSMEMSRRQIYARLLANISTVSGEKIKKRNYNADEKEKVKQAHYKLGDGSIIIDDQSFINITQLVRRIRLYIRKYGIKVVLIDYLQLIKGILAKGGNREAEIAEITRQLKALAQEMQIPIVILCQLSREVEKRKPLCLPQMADLRESGAIEQDADKVILLWRPEYYGVDEPTNFRRFNQKINNKGLLSWIVAKHREGDLGNIPSLFTPWNMTVGNHPELSSTFLPPSDEVANKINNELKFNANEQYSINPDDEPKDVPF